MFPYSAKESVPVWLLLIICFLGPVIVIAFISLSNFKYERNLHDFHSGVLGLCLGLSMTIMLTDIIKVTAGRPRPDMLSRCQPPSNMTDPMYGLTSVDICTTDKFSHVMIDGFKSFPSGHSSFSFAGLGFLAFYIAGKMKMFDERGHTYKGFIFAFPIMGALLVAISRTEDYRHHWQDVTIGALLGIFCSYFAYRQYYPALSHAQCRDPYYSRVAYCKRLVDEERGIIPKKVKNRGMRVPLSYEVIDIDQRPLNTNNFAHSHEDDLYADDNRSSAPLNPIPPPHAHP